MDIVYNNWENLNKFLDSQRHIPYVEAILEELEGYPISLDTIGNLLKEGWECEFFKGGAFVCGGVDPTVKKIKLAPRQEPYFRDLTLFHEIAHVYYRDLFVSSTEDLEEIAKGYSGNLGGRALHDIKEAAVEKAGRIARANFRLLGHTVKSFGLEPKIYDLSSYYAFTPKENRDKRTLEKYREIGVLLDYPQVR